jgi:hypothetical protein
MSTLNELLKAVLSKIQTTNTKQRRDDKRIDGNNWSQLIQDREQRRSVLNMAKKRRVP